MVGLFMGCYVLCVSFVNKAKEAATSTTDESFKSFARFSLSQIQANDQNDKQIWITKLNSPTEDAPVAILLRDTEIQHYLSAIGQSALN